MIPRLLHHLRQAAPQNTTCAALALSCIVSTSTLAETSKLDVQVGAKAAAFVQPALKGDIPTAIVFDSSNPASKADADNIMTALNGGLAIQQGKLAPVMVDVAALDHLADVKVAYITHGVSSHLPAIASVAAQHNVLTISNDMACVESDSCAVGVASKPKVSIIVSKKAVAAAHLQFSSAFLMMVTER